jgi:hypothetical protein
MSRSASASSLYESLYIEKNGVKVDLSGKTINFSYYESLLSPIITASMVIVDTGSSLQASKEQDSSERTGTIVSSLPIVGNEAVSFKIKSKLGTLNFERTPLYVNGAPVAKQEGSREVVAINLISKAAKDNETSIVNKKYKGNIADSVFKILTEILKVPSNRIFIDPTFKNYNFFGGNKDPFTVLISLASKSIPNDNSDPGYFIYENQNGINFKSISKLISAEPVNKNNPYKKFSVLRKDDEENDYKILSMSQSRNQSLLNVLRSGVYSSRNIFFNPRTFEYKEVIVKLGEKGLKAHLGKDVQVPQEFGNYHRTHFHILDIGCLEDGIDIETNNSPELWQALSTVRYNLLFTQVLNITVPCNPNLKAGDVIECLFEKRTTDNRNLGAYDDQQSGRYLILDLSHNFDPTRSFTSLTLVRDTYGRYSKNSKSRGGLVG